MAQQLRSELLSREGRLSLAAKSFHRDPTQAVRTLATSFDVPESTLQTRIRGVRPKHEIKSQQRKLQPSEEEALVDWVLELGRRGFPAPIIDLRRMADALLAAIPPPLPVGINWPSRFIKAQAKLQTKRNRKLHSQRAKCEGPVKINAWFTLVRETRQTYGIGDGDMYNFDETGFMMGVAATSKVITSSDTVGRAINVQLGNRDWLTSIEAVNASSWPIPPFLILSGKRHQASWYRSFLLDIR
jgi:hypothetical protein